MLLDAHHIENQMNKVSKHMQFFHYSLPIPENHTGLLSSHMMALAFCFDLRGQALSQSTSWE